MRGGPRGQAGGAGRRAVTPASDRYKSLIADGWYSWITDLPAFSDWLARRPRPVAWAARAGPVRGLLLFALSLRRDRVAVLHDGPGWRSLLAKDRDNFLAEAVVVDRLPKGSGERRASQFFNVYLTVAGQDDDRSR